MDWVMEARERREGGGDGEDRGGRNEGEYRRE